MSLTSFSQEINLKGFALDSITTLPISNATVVVSYSKNENNIIQFTRTSKSGFFDLKFAKKVKFNHLWLTFRHISYGSKKVQLENISQSIDIVLKEKESTLKEIIIKSKKKVTVKGDTITYTTNGLKRKSDFTIEDVIARIPGVKISENGRITYKNKAISHLYINDVDLLEGRYNLATRGIPASAVEEIDVLKKHNHAKIDKGVTYSDNVALNLKIKKGQRLVFGKAVAKLGVPILTRELDVTPIYLKEKLQNLTSLKHNNIGKSLESNGVSLTQGNGDLQFFGFDNLNILNPPNTSGAYVGSEYWLNNKSNSITSDGLYKNNKDLITKIAFSYNADVTNLENSSNQLYFFGTDSSKVSNSTKNNMFREKFYTNIVHEINKKNIYLKNKLIFQNNNSNGESQIIQNGNPFNYFFNRNKKTIKNTTEFKIKLNKKIIDNGILFGYNSNEEQGLVNPSVFDEVIPNILNSEETIQNIETKQTYLGGYSSYNFNIGEIQSEFKQRILWQSEGLKSNLRQSSSDVFQNVSNYPFISDFSQQTFNSTTSLKTIYRLKRYTLIVRPELTYIKLNYKESFSNKMNSNNYLFFQPRVKIKYKANHLWDFSLTNNYTSYISQFSELYDAVILKSFNVLFRNPSEINVTRNYYGSFNSSYSDILNNFLFSNNVSFSNSNSNFIVSNSINENGLLQSEALEAPNNRTTFINKLSFAKSFFSLLQVNVDYTYNKTKLEQVFNTINQEIDVVNHSIDLGINLDYNTWYSLVYKGVLNFGKTKSNSFERSNTYFKHNINLDLYTSAKTRINLESESIQTKFGVSDIVNSNTFFNSRFYYKFSKSLLIEASFNNILNQKFFTTVSNSINLISESQFSLRPRQFTVGVNFSF